MHKRAHRRPFLTGVLLLVLLLVMGCGGSGQKAAAPAPAAPAPAAKAPAPAAAPPAAQPAPAAPAAAPAKAPAGVSEAELVELAKKEGQLMVYTASGLTEFEPMFAAFKKKYPFLKADFYRATAPVVTDRVMKEAQAGAKGADVVYELRGFDLEAMKRQGVLAPFNGQVLADIPAALRDPGGTWVGDNLQIFVQAVNTNLVPEAQRPKQYEDVLDPKWKGKTIVADTDFEWMEAFYQTWGQDKAAKYFDQLGKQNLVVIQGKPKAADMIAAGEYPLALTVYPHGVVRLMEKKAPIAYFILEPLIVRTNAIGVLKGAKNPGAGALFMHWILSEEGQNMSATLDMRPTNRKSAVKDPVVRARLEKNQYYAVDIAKTVDKWSQLEKQWEQVIKPK